MLGFPKDVEEIILSPQTGLINNMRSNTYLVDHTSSSPELAKTIF